MISFVDNNHAREVITDAYIAFKDVVEGRVEFHGLPVTPDLLVWGREFPEGYCSVCLAGAHHLALRQELMSDEQTEASEIEYFLSWLSTADWSPSSRYSVRQGLSEVGVVLPLERSPNVVVHDQPRALIQFLEELINLNWPTTQQALLPARQAPEPVTVGVTI